MTSHGDYEVFPMQFSNQPYQINRSIACPSANIVCIPTSFAPRRVSSKHQNVVNPAGSSLMQYLHQLLSHHACTGQMHQYIDPTIPLGVRRHCQGPSARRTSRPPRDIDEERVQPTCHTVNSSQEIVETSFCFWRKELEGVVPMGG